MVIDLEKAKSEFLKYTEGFDLDNENIRRKKYHSLRVMAVAERIAKYLNLSEEQIEVASLIGLLHDIARFEQYTQFKTFNDLLSFDHGDYALKILDRDMRKYVEFSEYDSLVKVAIRNHNKYEIENGLSEKELLFSKIIRDADKIDIFYEAVEMFWNGLENQVNSTEISENVEIQFKNQTQIKREKNNNTQNVDGIIGVIAFIYDINFSESFKILKERDFINKILDRFDFKDKKTKDKVKEIRELAYKYINEKIEE